MYNAGADREGNKIFCLGLLKPEADKDGHTDKQKKCATHPSLLSIEMDNSAVMAI
jgi:hypothetical protein